MMVEWKRIDFTIRKAEATKIMTKYPDRIPVICYPMRKTDPSIDKNKYLVPYDISFGQLAYVIRKRLKMAPSQALYFYVEGVIPTSSHHIQELYSRYRDPDGFLYVVYSAENTFGNASLSVS